MTVETQLMETRKAQTKRKFGPNKGGKGKKRVKMFSGTDNKVKIDGKMKKLFRKRARDYNSDNDDDEDEDNEDEDADQPAVENINQTLLDNEEVSDGNSSGEDGDNDLDADEEKGASGDERDEIQPGITRFTDGCRAFRMAFTNIIKKAVSDNTLGPVLSGHTKLVAEKLAEESEQKVKGEAKKEKQLVREKGHVKPANFLDSHEKFLISVATKGVVKLFNAVNKAQNAQKGLNPSRSKDAKVLGKRRKQAFLAELHKKPSQAAGIKGTKSGAEDEGPAWAPLRDSYMLTNSKLKNWDKMADTTTGDDTRAMHSDNSSDED